MLLARGEWIALLDQDDRWAPTKLEKQLQCVAEHPNAVAVFCAVHFIDATGVRTGTRRRRSCLREMSVTPCSSGTASARRACSAVPCCRSAGFQMSRPDWPIGCCGCPSPATGLLRSCARRSPTTASTRPGTRSRCSPRIDCASRRTVARGQSQRNRLHERCAVCSRIHSRARRRCGDLFLRAARAALRNGDSPRATQALRMAWFAAPAWLLRPWVVLPQALRLLASALRGWAPG